MSSTTDTVDAGLVDGLLKAAYFKARPGDTLQYTAVGTGKALDDARAGLADVVITHAPSLEEQFFNQGYSLGPGRQIFYSDYVIVGPKSDPAGVIANGHAHDAISALEDIAAAGDEPADDVRFLSRGENSGTNVQEQLMWGLSGVTKNLASNNSGNPDRFEPWDPTKQPANYPDWYKKTGVGQAANLNQTEACAVSNGCYTMLDRGTFNRGIDAGTVNNLKIVAEKNTPGVRGGENLLINPFSVYILNPNPTTPYPAGSPTPNVAAATRFVNFLVSPAFQAAVAGFPSSLDPAFRPDAFPGITLDSSLPRTAVAGTTLTIAGTAANLLPGGGPISGLPVQLQQSTNNGASWSDVGSAVNTDAGGHFSTAAAFARTTRYRLSTPAFAAASYNQFSPAAQEIGVVALPVVGQSPPPPAARDTTAPKVTRIRITRRGISLRVSEGSDVRLVIQRRVKKGGKVRYRTVEKLSLGSTRAKLLRGHHEVLKAGKYRIKITVRDEAGNRRTLTKTFTRR